MDVVFKSAFGANPEIAVRALELIDTETFLTVSDRNVLRAIILYTPNSRLLQNFKKFDQNQMERVARLSYEALKMLRSWPGRPTSTPTASPSGSQPGSPVRTRPRTPTGSSSKNSPSTSGFGKLSTMTPEPERVAKLRTDGTLAIVAAPGPVEITDIFVLLGINNPLPSLPKESTRGSHDSRYSKDCLERQSERSALTGRTIAAGHAPYETAHLFPLSALKSESSKVKIVWRFLTLFLGEDKCSLLMEELTSENRGVHTCANRIAIEKELHTLFDRGGMRLVPTGRRGANWLEVALTWLAPAEVLSGHNTLWPPNPEDQYPPLTILEPEQSRKLRPRERIRFFSSDIERLPLPSAILLHWNALLWNVLGASGLGEFLEQKTFHSSNLFMKSHRTTAGEIDEASTGEGEGVHDSERENRKRKQQEQDIVQPHQEEETTEDLEDEHATTRSDNKRRRVVGGYVAPSHSDNPPTEKDAMGSGGDGAYDEDDWVDNLGCFFADRLNYGEAEED